MVQHSSADAEIDFILNLHTLAKQVKKLKNKINLKTDSNCKESMDGEIKNAT